jgi:hypothetical protein
LRVEYLRTQLEWLYGPLSCQLSVNAMMLAHANNLSARGLEAYGPHSASWSEIFRQRFASLSSSNDDGLLEIPEAGDWTDLFGHSYNQRVILARLDALLPGLRR